MPFRPLALVINSADLLFVAHHVRGTGQGTGDRARAPWSLTLGGQAEDTGHAGGTRAPSARERRAVWTEVVVLDGAAKGGVIEKVTNTHLES